MRHVPSTKALVPQSSQCANTLVAEWQDLPGSHKIECFMLTTLGNSKDGNNYLVSKFKITRGDGNNYLVSKFKITRGKHAVLFFISFNNRALFASTVCNGMALHGYQRGLEFGQKVHWENHQWLLGKMVTVHQLFGKENDIITMWSVGGILHREIRSGETQTCDKIKRQTLGTR